MNICYLSRTFHKVRGGVESYTYTMARFLADMGHIVHIITSTGGEECYTDIQNYKNIHIHKIQYKNRLFLGSWMINNIFSIFDLFYSYSVSKKINQLIDEYEIDVVESPDWLFEGFFYSFKKRVPLVVRLHGHEFKKYSPLNIARRLRYFFERSLILNADRVVSVSDSYASFARSKFSLKDKIISTIYPGIDHRMFYQKTNKAPSEPNVLFVGRLREQKGVKIMEEAIPLVIKQLPGIRFIFVGRNCDLEIKNCLMMRHGGNVAFYDEVWRDKLVDFYNNATVCAFPSKYESFGIAAAEAMLCSCTIVASKVRGFSEYIVDGFNGLLVEPNNPNEMANALIKLLKSPELRSGLAKNAAKTAHEKFDLSVILDKTVSSYQEVIKSKANNGGVNFSTRNANPLVSVVIPTYNRVERVTSAIDSVLKQTYKNIEIVVVDDGSTDNTKGVLREYTNKIRYFYKDNGGVSSARNLGISNARGEYISFLDSDDTWEDEKIAIQLRYLQDNKILDAVISDVKFVDRDGNVAARASIGNYIPKEGMMLEYLVGHFQTMCTILMKRHIFEEVGYFDEVLNTAEDIDMLLRIASKYKIGILSMPLVVVNSSESGLSNRIFTGNQLAVIKKLEQYNPDFAKKRKRLMRATLARINLRYADDLLCHRYIKDARNQIAESLKNSVTIEALGLYGKSFLINIASLVMPQYRDRGVFVPERTEREQKA